MSSRLRGCICSSDLRVAASSLRDERLYVVRRPRSAGACDLPASREYGERGCGKVRRYLHNEDDARPHGREIRTPDPLLPKEVDGVTRWFNSSMG